MQRLELLPIPNIPCPSMALLEIGPYMYVNEPKFQSGTFDLLVFRVILESRGAHISKWPETRNRCPRRNVEWNLEVGGSCKHVYGVPLTF